MIVLRNFSSRADACHPLRADACHPLRADACHPPQGGCFSSLLFVQNSCTDFLCRAAAQIFSCQPEVQMNTEYEGAVDRLGWVVDRECTMKNTFC